MKNTYIVHKTRTVYVKCGASNAEMQYAAKVACKHDYELVILLEGWL